MRSAETAGRGDADSDTDGHGVKGAGMEGVISSVIEMKPEAKGKTRKHPMEKAYTYLTSYSAFEQDCRVLINELELFEHLNALLVIRDKL